MSNDGQYVVFQSNSNDYDEQVGGVANNSDDIFVFDRDANDGAGRIVGVTNRAGFQAYGDSVRASISPDGRYVVFASDATNLVSDDDNGHGDTFVYDLQNHTFQRISVAQSGAEGDSESTLGADISFGGAFAAFGGTAGSLVVPGDSDGGLSDVFVVDRSAGTVGVVVEDNTTPDVVGAPVTNKISTHGAFNFSDVDLNDSHSVLLTGVTIDTSRAPAGFTVPVGGLGTFTPAIVDTNDAGQGQVAWTFAVDNALVQGLNAFEQVRQVYTVRISDGQGGMVTQTVTIASPARPTGRSRLRTRTTSCAAIRPRLPATCSPTTPTPISATPWPSFRSRATWTMSEPTFPATRTTARCASTPTVATPIRSTTTTRRCRR